MYSEMYEEDPYDDYWFSEPREITCKFCNKSGLNWMNYYGHWKLVEGTGLVHECETQNKLGF